MVTVQMIDDVPPHADGRQWTTEQYQQRDRVLRSLGVPMFGRGQYEEGRRSP
jgi:hypothetical protein